MTERIRTLVAVAVAALLLALPIYWHGVTEGEVLNWEGADEMCPARPGVIPGPVIGPSNNIRILPLANECRWGDGFAVELVPWWINPALAVLLLTAALCLVLAAWVAHVARAQKRETGEKS